MQLFMGDRNNYQNYLVVIAGAEIIAANQEVFCRLNNKGMRFYFRNLILIQKRIERWERLHRC